MCVAWCSAFLFCPAVSRGSEYPVFEYGAGCEQQFEADHTITPGQLIGEGYDPTAGHNTIPLALLMETDQQDGESGGEGN